METSELVIISVCRFLHFCSNLHCKWSDEQDPDSTLLAFHRPPRICLCWTVYKLNDKAFLSLGSFLLTGFPVNCYSSILSYSFAPVNWAQGFVYSAEAFASLLTNQHHSIVSLGPWRFTLLHPLCIGGDRDSPNALTSLFVDTYVLSNISYSTIGIPLEAAENDQGKPCFQLWFPYDSPMLLESITPLQREDNVAQVSSS